MKKLVLLTLIFAFALTMLLCGCAEKAEVVDGFTLAAEEDDATRAALDKTLTAFFDFYEKNDVAGAMTLLSKSFSATEEEVKTFFENIKKDTANAKFKPYDRYYMPNLTVSDEAINVKHTPEDTDYIMVVPAERELCNALYLGETQNASYMLSLMLIREGDEFKIGFITPTLYSHRGQRAPEIFEKTKALKNAGKTVTAYVYSCILGSSYRPGGYMRYNDDEAMQSLCYELFSEVEEKFPLPLALVNTSNSAVHQLSIISGGELGTIPRLLVSTDAPIGDKAALSAECEKVISALDQLSGGLTEEFSSFHFEFTNDEITEDTQSPKAEIVVYNINK